MYWAPTDLYLAHHGILGMKWGVRRFQNSDGSLTAAGKQRYSRQTYQDIKDGYLYKDRNLTRKGVREKVSKDDLYKQAVDLERKLEDIANKWTEDHRGKFDSNDKEVKAWNKFTRNSAKYKKLSAQAEQFVVELCNKYGNASLNDSQTIWWDIWDYGLTENEKQSRN